MNNSFVIATRLGRRLLPTRSARACSTKAAALDWSAQLEFLRNRRRAASKPDSSTEQQTQKKQEQEETDGPEKAAESLSNWREKIQDETERKQAESQVFAYPASARVPWATLSLLALSAGVTAAVAVSRRNVEGERWVRASDDYFSICGGNAAAHPSLLLASLWRDETYATSFMHAAIFALSGTLLEKLHGPAALLSLTIGGTLATNLMLFSALPKLPPGTADLPVIGTSGGLAAVVGVCAFR